MLRCFLGSLVRGSVLLPLERSHYTRFGLVHSTLQLLSATQTKNQDHVAILVMVNNPYAAIGYGLYGRPGFNMRSFDHSSLAFHCRVGWSRLCVKVHRLQEGLQEAILAAG